MRRTKIICTIGPSTCRYEQLEKLAECGMNVARLNMSHGTHEWHRGVIKSIRTLNEKAMYNVAILLDTKGPEIRSGDLKKEVVVQKGTRFVFTIRREAEYDDYCTEVSYDGFIHDVEVGDVILVDGGIISFMVLEKTDSDIICECIDGGILTSRRHLNVRGRSATLPSITSKDWEDIEFGIAEGIDFIALSFVKEAEVIRDLKRKLEARHIAIGVIAKIESAASIPHLDEILEVCDGAMVARGDLGAEIPLEDVPLVQEKIVSECWRMGKPSIVATHLLESMIVYPTPTRAEVSDIAVAVNSRADAIMLSGETALGRHPFKAVEVMNKVAIRIEESQLAEKKISVPPSMQPKEEMVMSASIIANNLETAALIVITRRGLMASLLSRCRPNPPIFAFTNTSNVRRKLNLYWGVHPFRIGFSKDPEKTLQRAIQLLKQKKSLAGGDRIVVVSDILVGDDYVETIQLRDIK